MWLLSSITILSPWGREKDCSSSFDFPSHFIHSMFLKIREEVKCTKVGNFVYRSEPFFPVATWLALSCLRGILYCLAVLGALKKTMKCLHVTQILNHHTHTYMLVSKYYRVCMIISKEHNQHKYNSFNILNFFYLQILEFSTSAKSYLFSCWEGFAGGWAEDHCAGFGLLSLFLQEKFPGQLKVTCVAVEPAGPLSKRSEDRPSPCVLGMERWPRMPRRTPQLARRPPGQPRPASAPALDGRPRTRPSWAYSQKPAWIGIIGLQHAGEGREFQLFASGVFQVTLKLLSLLA